MISSGEATSEAVGAYAVSNKSVQLGPDLVKVARKAVEGRREHKGIAERLVRRCKRALLGCTVNCVEIAGSVCSYAEYLALPTFWAVDRVTRALRDSGEQSPEQRTKQARAASLAACVSLGSSGTLTRLGNSHTTVVILGGGFAGLKVRAELLAARMQALDVIMIDDKDFFEYTPAVLRAMCAKKKGSLQEIAARFETGNPDIITGRVSRVSNDRVTLYDGREVLFDFLVVATGGSYGNTANNKSSFAAVIKPQSGTLEARARDLANARAELESARSVVIMGGGLVGVELAAELVEAFPGLDVTLVHTGPELLSSGTVASGARRSVTRWLENHGVHLALNAASVTADYDKKLCTFSVRGSGNVTEERTVPFDVCFECTGLVPNTGFLRTEFADCLQPGGLIRVNDYLQVEQDSAKGPIDHIFALGDCAWHETTAGSRASLSAELQASVVAHNIAALVSGAPGDSLQQWPYSLTRCATSPTLSIASLGELDGSIYFESVVVNGFLASVLKRVVEETKKQQLAGNPFGRLVWSLGDAVTLLVYREFFAAPRRVIPAFSF